MDLAASIEALEKELKNDDPRFSKSNTKKADLLFVIKNTIEVYDGDISKQSSSLESVILLMCCQECTSPLRRLMKRTLGFLFASAKSTKVMNFLLELLKITQSLKYSTAAKLTSFDLIGYLHTSMISKLVSPPTEEILESCKRLYKSADIPSKTLLIKCLTSILQSRPSNLTLISSEYSKFLLKTASEKQPEIKNISAKGLISLARNYSINFHGQFENCIQICFKMMEENSSDLPGVLLGEILSINIDVSLAGHYFTNQRKALDQFPKTLNDLNYFLTQYMSRLGSREAKTGLLIAADVAYEKFIKKSLQSHIELNAFIEGYINMCTRSCSTENETWWVCESFSWLSQKVVAYISEQQAIKTLEYLKMKITALPQLLSEQSSNDSDPSKFAAEGFAHMSLRLVSLISQKPIESKLMNILKDLDKPLITLLKYPRVQLQACWTIESIVKSCPGLVLLWLSQAVTNTTMVFAELEGLRTQSFTREFLNTNIMNLIGNASCLSTLIKSVTLLNRGVPVEEIEMAFCTIKNLVSNEFQGEIIDEEKIFNGDANFQELDNAKRQASWIIVDGLMNLGPSWVGSRLSLLFGLWKLPFGRKTCIFENQTPSWAISEVSHKKVASAALLSFMKHNKTLLQPQIFKLITVYISNALQFLSPTKNSTQHRIYLEQNCSIGTLTELKKNLYECLLYLPNSFVSTKINLMLNPIYSEVINERSNNMPMFFYYTGRSGKKGSALMQLVEQWVSNEDGYIHAYKANSFLHSISLVGYEGYFDSWEQKHEISPVFSEMMSYTLRIFSDIFTNSSLNVSNRQKLFTFMSQHLSLALKNKESLYKYNKVCTILLVVHGCLMKLSLSRGIITDSTLTKCIKSMLTSVEGISNPLVKCLFSEGMIYLCKVMGDPQHIPVFMKEIEHRIILSETTPSIKSGIVMQVGNMYKHFDGSILEKNQDALGHIIQSISRDPTVGAWALHALYKAYSVQKGKVENIFKATFPLGYHHYLDDHKAEFDFKSTMMLLCEKNILLNPVKDAYYLRSRLIWEDTWKSSFFKYDCALRLMALNPSFDVKEIVDHAISLIPDKQALKFLLKGPMETFVNTKSLVEWFTIFDKLEDVEVETFITDIIWHLLLQSRDLSILKQIILSAEKEQEEEAKGLSALNDRESTTQSLGLFSLKSKLKGAQLYIKLIKSFPEHFQSRIDENINFAVHLTSFTESLSIEGLELASTIFKCYKDLADPDEPQKKFIEIFEAQVSATLRENLDSPNIELCLSSNKLFLKFLTVPGSHDVDVLSKIIKNLVNTLSSRYKEGYTELKAAQLYINRLLLLAKALLKAPDFISELIREHSGVLRENFNIVLTDFCVLFTQSRNVLKEHRFLLGKQPINQEDSKMGSVEVFIRASALLRFEEDLEFFISNIFAFLFLPYCASREISAFYNQYEVNRCMKRRESVLKAMKDIIGLITDEKILSEVVICMELCTKTPSVAHKELLLQLCKNISNIQPIELNKLEKLIIGIFNSHKELQQQSLEAWGWAAIKYSEFIIRNEIIDLTSARNSVGCFFLTCVQCNPSMALSIVDAIWNLGELGEHQIVIANFVLEKMWDNAGHELVLNFLSAKTASEFPHFSQILQKASDAIMRFNSESIKTIAVLMKLQPSSGLFNYCLPFVLKVFRLRKPEFTTEEILFLSETIKLLMTILLKSNDKPRIFSGIFPLFISLYHKSYPLSIIKSVSKALTYINNSLSAAFKQSLSTLSVPEQRFIESQLETTLTSSAPTPAQPTITLSLKFKKP